MAINLTQVPFPNVIETLDFEVTLAEVTNDFVAIWKEARKDRPELPAYDVQMLESDSIKIVLEVFAYLDILKRARVNDVSKALMLATTGGTDLDNFAADFGMERLVVGYAEDGNPVYESDDAFRQRRNLAPDGYAAAGPEDAYRYYALSADGSIKQVAAVKGESNRCDIILLGRDGDGAVSQEIVAKVYDALSPKTRRPLTDNVYVRSAAIVHQPIKVNITIHSGPDPMTIAAKAKTSIEKYAQERASIGAVLRVDGIIGAAHSGNALESAVVIEPETDVDPGKFGAIYVPEIIVEVI